MGSRKGTKREGIDQNENCCLIAQAISEISGPFPALLQSNILEVLCPRRVL